MSTKLITVHSAEVWKDFLTWPSGMALCGVIGKLDDQIGCSQSHQSECGVWLDNGLQVAGAKPVTYCAG